MFCPKCGKKNEDNSLFCTWCGAGFGSISSQSLNAAQNPPADALKEAENRENPAQQPSEVPQTVPAESFRLEGSADNSGASVSSLSEVKQPAQTAFGIPTPGMIPQSSEEHAQFAQQSISPSAVNVPNVQNVQGGSEKTLSFYNEVPVASVQKPEKERRYFTAAHIAICLAVAGVMAAAAGVFAGLYFSTIL